MIGAETAIDATRRRKAPRWRALGVLLAALALVIQSFVVQPHIDGAGAFANTAGARCC